MELCSLDQPQVHHLPVPPHTCLAALCQVSSARRPGASEAPCRCSVLMLPAQRFPGRDHSPSAVREWPAEWRPAVCPGCAHPSGPSVFPAPRAPLLFLTPERQVSEAEKMWDDRRGF